MGSWRPRAAACVQAPESDGGLAARTVPVPDCARSAGLRGGCLEVQYPDFRPWGNPFRRTPRARALRQCPAGGRSRNAKRRARGRTALACGIYVGSRTARSKVGICWFVVVLANRSSFYFFGPACAEICTCLSVGTKINALVHPHCQQPHTRAVQASANSCDGYEEHHV